MNKATSDCSFVNLGLIFTTLGIGVMAHAFGCHGNHFGRKLCYPSYQNEDNCGQCNGNLNDLNIYN